MRFFLNRLFSTEDETIGVLGWGNSAKMFTLEDEYRDQKVMHETRIPEGTYMIEPRTWGGFHERYSRRWPWHQSGMMWLKDVPGFEHILIHPGNTDEDTSGCILVGEGAHTNGLLPGMSIASSVAAYRRLYGIWQASLSGVNTITIADLDR